MDSIDFHLEAEQWKLEGACVNKPVDLFFDYYEDYPEVAKRVDTMCAECPVREQCLEYGIENDESGVWAGRYLVLGKYSRSRNSHKPRPQMSEEEQEVKDVRSNL